MQTASLFNTSSEVSGFRLDNMEVYNWGLFDGQVYRINPKGNSSLLTGSNASGKSTLIDAMLTLLVPQKRKRFYNQSSGADRRDNRTEESYFFGNYGSQGSKSTMAKRLRDKNARSVLLACFKNVDGRSVTLFQVRYFSGDEVRPIFGISKEPLTIANDFMEFDLKGVWRKHLDARLNANSKKKRIEFFDGPNEYARKLILLFGMRSDRALTLFNQIVGVKVLDDLNEFIRDNMLDVEDTETEYVTLRENFNNLLGAKINIEKTEEQISQLHNIDDLAKKIQQLQAKINQYQEERKMAVSWFIMQASKLRGIEIEKCKFKIDRITSHLEALKAKLESLREDERKTKNAIDNDEVANRIRVLVEQIKELEKKRDERSRACSGYNGIARKFELVLDPNQDEYDDNYQDAKNKKAEIEEGKDSAEREKYSTQHEAEEINKQAEIIAEQVKYLLAHNYNIPQHIDQIRTQLLEYTGAKAEEMPFVGELIKVRDDETRWELAIERVLHNFGLCLLVPERYYKDVNYYVHNHNLKGRIVYYRYDGYVSMRNFEYRLMPDNCILNKIEFKPDSQFTEWIEDMIARDFNYTCVDTVNEFNAMEQKAVMISGLVKTVKGRHEKDDRAKKLDRADFMLGWDNTEKINALKEQVKRLNKQWEELDKKIKALQDLITQADESIRSLTRFIDFYTYDMIDWQTYAIEIQEKKKEKKSLEESNDQVRQLNEQLKSLIIQIEANEEEQKKQSVAKTRTEDQLARLEKDAEASSDEPVDESAADYANNHPELLKIEYDEIEANRRAYIAAIDNDIINAKSDKSAVEIQARKAISLFKRPEPDLLERYKDWTSDVHQLPDEDHLEFISEYQVFYKRLLEENLPAFKNDFDHYLQENVLQSIGRLKNFFDRWVKAIEDTIKTLNQQLELIDFNNDTLKTFIRLTAIGQQSVYVKEFRQMLEEAALPNLRQMDSTVDGRKVHFETKIVPLIRKLEDEKWREEVMDVRTWYTYRAEEIYRDSEQIVRVYEGMAELSGGEKAQLTYTILGAAIAYQFGLTHSGLDSSFRFIAIDEAFKAQDDDKAKYLIDLCKQLHLQLLVVTPSNNIHIVENDISYVHYVEKIDNRSVVYDMPIMEYKEITKDIELQ